MKTEKNNEHNEIIETFSEFELNHTEMLNIRGGDGSGPETDPDPPVIVIPEEG